MKIAANTPESINKEVLEGNWADKLRRANWETPHEKDILFIDWDSGLILHNAGCQECMDYYDFIDGRINWLDRSNFLKFRSFEDVHKLIIPSCAASNALCELCQNNTGAVNIYHPDIKDDAANLCAQCALPILCDESETTIKNTSLGDIFCVYADTCYINSPDGDPWKFVGMHGIGLIQNEIKYEQVRNLGSKEEFENSNTDIAIRHGRITGDWCDLSDTSQPSYPGHLCQLGDNARVCYECMATAKEFYKRRIRQFWELRQFADKHLIADVAIPIYGYIRAIQ